MQPFLQFRFEKLSQYVSQRLSCFFVYDRVTYLVGFGGCEVWEAEIVDFCDEVETVAAGFVGAEVAEVVEEDVVFVPEEVVFSKMLDWDT